MLRHSNGRARLEIPQYGCGFLVPYEIREIAKKGKGAIAQERIARGTVVWHGGENASKRYTEAEVREKVKQMSREDAGRWLNHAYGVVEDPDVLFESIGDAALYNHSKTPNTGCGTKYKEVTGADVVKPSNFPSSIDFDPTNACFALRDIEAGEEITEEVWSDRLSTMLPGLTDRVVCSIQRITIRPGTSTCAKSTASNGPEK